MYCPSIFRKYFPQFVMALSVAALLFNFLTIVVKADAPASGTGDEWIATQHRSDACVLAAVATNLNYVSGGYNYTSAGLGLAYRLKFGNENWAQDGNTSHEAQMLAADAGFKVSFGRMSEWGDVAALKYLAWAKRYPVVFLNGSPQHAVVVLELLNENTLRIADPWTGKSYEEQADSFYVKLEPMKWYFYAQL